MDGLYVKPHDLYITKVLHFKIVLYIEYLVIVDITWLLSNIWCNLNKLTM